MLAQLKDVDRNSQMKTNRNELNEAKYPFMMTIYHLSYEGLGFYFVCIVKHVINQSMRHER